MMDNNAIKETKDVLMDGEIENNKANSVKHIEFDVQEDEYLPHD